VPIVFIVDDNLIGNKAAIKKVLVEVRDWQQRKGYPLAFFTEASIDLADDPELLQLMVECNIIGVFVGIESPNEASLRETKKFQNLRTGGTMLDKVKRIQRSGMEVWCGMIVGFDNDDASIFDAQREFARKSRITSVMLGMLHALPKTPLYDRLAAEGRLDMADEPEFGSNVIPIHLSREELRDGYAAVMKDLYEPESYFDRLDELVLGENLKLGNRNLKEYWKRHRWVQFKTNARDWAVCAGLYLRLMWSVPDASLRKLYKRRIRNLLAHRWDASILIYYLIKCAMHYHAYKMVQQFDEVVVSSFA